MKVGVYYKNDDVRVEDRPMPKPGPGEVLVKVEACGICGSDVMEWYRAPKAPLVLGHELTATIEEVGAEVSRFKVGERVVVSHHVPCNTCRFCRSGHHTVCDTLRSTNIDPGGFAQYARVPAMNVDRGLFHLPENLSFDEGTFVEPLGCAVRGQHKAGMRAGRSVLVIGSGLAGVLHVKLATALGAGAVFAADLNRWRLEFAKTLGAQPIDAREEVPKKLRELNSGQLADVVIVSTGAPAAVEQAFRCVERGGTILFFASPPRGVSVPYPVFDVWKDEVSVANTYGASPHDMESSLDLLRSGRVKVADLITHRLPLEQIGDGFRITAVAGESMKIVVHPNA